MNESQKYNNIADIKDINREKNINSKKINNKNNNKDVIRKQKRLFQMQKRLALLNEEDLPQLDLDGNIKIKEEPKISNILDSFQKLGEIQAMKNKTNYNINNNKSNLSFNDNSYNNNNLNIEQIHHQKSIENQNLKNNNSEMKQEEEISLKKKNTNSNSNDEDKSSTEAVLPNEIDINRKKSKSIFQNESIEGDVSNKIISGDIDDNPNIFSRSNDNDNDNDNNDFEDININEINITNIVKDDLEKKDNLTNEFDFCNIINDKYNENESNSNDENIKNDNSIIINEMEEENNINNDENEDKNDSKELNISNLEIDINEIKEENSTQNIDYLTLSESNSNEFAKKYLSSKSKSFIKFNNNLTARVAAHSINNSPSYMLALCPELLGGVDKKKLIKENYVAADAISEEIESDMLTPRQSEKIEEISIKEIKEEKNKNNNSINAGDYLRNKTLRNKEIQKRSIINLKNGEKISSKAHYKNRSKIDKNRCKNYQDLETKINHLNKSNQKKKINKNIYNNSNTNILSNSNNFFQSNYFTNNEKSKNNIKNNIHMKLIIRHQKAKSLNNNQINSFGLHMNVNNIKNNERSPKQTSQIFNKKNIINKIQYNNIDKSKTKINKDNEKKDYLYYKQNYSSNNNNKNSNPKFLKKTNINEINNTSSKTHNYCKSDIRDKIIDLKSKYSYLKRNNESDLSKSNQFIQKKSNILYDNNKICYTEKANKSKNYMGFISHIKKNTPDNINNISEQNINHSKKLSQQFADGYKFIMNSINSNRSNNKSNKKNDNIKNIKRKKIYSNKFNIKSTPLSNYFSFNKNKINNSNNNNITFIKKNNNLIKADKNQIVPKHNKSKTSLIAPTYQNLNQTKNRLLKKYTLINKSKKKNEISTKNIKKIGIKKINNKFNEIKKIVKDSSLKIIHKKINTIGNPNELTKLLNNNSTITFNKQLKDSSSNSNYKNNFNKHKIIMALQHIKFSPMENYSKALNELYKSKKNLFIILVYTDSIKRYIFRGLYEVNSNNPKIANKLFAPGYGQNILNANKFHNFINYQSNNGEFIRIKFNNANEKKFNTDTVIVY